MADGHTGWNGMRIDDDVRTNTLTCEWHILGSIVE